MGYSIRTLDTNFTISFDKMDDAYEALCKLNAENGYGSEYNDQLPTSTNLGLLNSSSYKVEDILQELGFSTNILPYGDLTVLAYNGKSADEEDFLKALAPFVEEGSYIEWIDEDNYLWRDYFVDGDMIIESGSIMWD